MFLTPSPLADILLLCIVGVMVAHSLYQIRRGRFMMMDPLNAFWGGCLVVYFIQPISFYSTVHSWRAEGIIEETLFWIFVAMISVVIGYELPVGIKVGSRLPTLPARLNPSKLVFAAIILLGLSFLAMWYQASLAGGWSFWISNVRGAAPMATSYITDFQGLLPVGVLLLFFADQLYGDTRTFRRGAVWALMWLTWLWFVYIGSRSRTVVCMIFIVAAYYLPRKKNPPLRLIIPTMVALFFLANFMAFFRGNFTDLSLHFEKLQWTDVKVKIFGAFLPNDPDVRLAKSDAMVSGGLEFNVVAATVELVPSRIGYNYGYGLLELFTRPIPHSWWPDKRYPRMEAYTPILFQGSLGGSWSTDTYLPILAGPSFTLVGFSYAAGGPIGTIFFGIISGVIFRIFRTFYDRDPNNQSHMIVYILLLQIGFGEACAEPFYWPIRLWAVFLPLILFLYLCQDRRTLGGDQFVPLPET